uniref:Conjugal transfer protein TraN n=1 Tax=uncultured Elusimicrobia bacterium TaxID=699876 RepID=A0A650EM60_9BACT|nr:hypothetical protein Elusimicrob1349_2030 [uncultured Elusimicrobia bacterium]
MKKLLALCLGFVPCAALAATNKIGMVTYFPVSYVAYSQVNAGQMDVGLTSTCDMKLGCDAASSPALQAETVKLESGRLDLNGGRGIKGDELSLGSGNATSANPGKIKFNNVRIQTGTMESVNANDVKAAELKLFDKKFPSCKDANTASNGQMSWKSLKLSGAAKDELYLACGDLGTASNSCPADKQPTKGLSYTENCPHGKTGQITYIWNKLTCEYMKKDNCLAEKITCITNSQWKTATNNIEVPDSCRLGGESHWALTYYATNMVCGNETQHHSGTRTLEELKNNCEPGQYYLYYETYGCRGSFHSGLTQCPFTKYGYYCLKCGTVSSESDCLTKSSLSNMQGQNCVFGGGSGGTETIKPVTPGDIVAQP